ncbi:unnamed protein product [Anisakis simplex]|uniref:Uncharacterized protein n=1 Tax=Anisakis simplex TaxID=6269 RepID=A0A0M3KKM6_ANISI|nr:unnamed protein product [Anisakis simplex]
MLMVERYHPGSRISRDTTSGESDSNASDLNCSPLLQSANIANSQIYAKRYFSPSNGAANRLLLLLLLLLLRS